MALKSLDDEPGYLKAGFVGFQSSGKTYTAAKLAIGVREYFKLEGPIAFFDTEAGTHAIKEMVKKHTGKGLVGERSRSFDVLMETAQDCVKNKVSVLIVDSLTHIWEGLRDAHLAAVNQALVSRGRNPIMNLEFQHWGPLKRKWAKWTEFFLNSPLHIIICARAGHEYGHEENSHGKKELIKVGIKMKAESEFGYEPSLVVEMERAVDKNDKDVRRATVIKDRFDVIDCATALNPDFNFFLPHIQKLNPNSHVAIDTTKKSTTELDNLGRDDYDRKKKDREIALEEIQAEMLKRWPGQTAQEKKMKVACLESVFGTTAWAKVEIMALDELKAGLSMIRNLNDKLEVSDAVHT